METLDFFVEEEQSFINLIVGEDLRFFDVLGEVGDDTGLHVSHLFVDFASEVVQIFFHLVDIWDLRCLKSAKTVAIEVLVETSTASLEQTFKLALKPADSLTHHNGFLIRSSGSWASALRE